MIKRYSQPFGEKLNDHTGAERRNDSSFSGSYDFELEEYQGQKNGNYHAGNIKNNFHIGKAYMGSVGDGFYKGFPGIEDDIGNGGGRWYPQFSVLGKRNSQRGKEKTDNK